MPQRVLAKERGCRRRNSIPGIASDPQSNAQHILCASSAIITCASHSRLFAAGAGRAQRLAQQGYRRTGRGAGRAAARRPAQPAGALQRQSTEALRVPRPRAAGWCGDCGVLVGTGGSGRICIRGPICSGEGCMDLRTTQCSLCLLTSVCSCSCLLCAFTCRSLHSHRGPATIMVVAHPAWPVASAYLPTSCAKVAEGDGDDAAGWSRGMSLSFLEPPDDDVGQRWLSGALVALTSWDQAVRCASMPSCLVEVRLPASSLVFRQYRAWRQ